MVRLSGSIHRVSKPNSRELESIYRIKCASSLELNCRTEVLRNYRANFAKSYNALALDYDGTLVSLFNRTRRLSPSIVNSIGNFLDGEIPVVIISGRGKSLLGLRQQLAKFDLDRLFLAMYNGAKIVAADSETIIWKEKRLTSSLNNVFRVLMKSSAILATNVKIVLKPYSIQIQVGERSMVRLNELCKQVRPILPNRFVVRSSGYAVDVYPRTRMKDYCLRLINKHFQTQLNYVRVGDQGDELGNDLELLRDKGSFSVGTVSTDRGTCFPVVDKWGNRLLGVRGCVHLLNQTFQLC